MKYKNAERILPQNLLDEIRMFIPEGYLYIPPEEERKPWGSANGTRQKLCERNRNICREYLQGKKVKALAEQYHLAENSIYHIIRDR